MHIKTCHPDLLPIKHLEYKSILSLLGSAREAIARLDEKLRQEKNAKAILEPLYWQEAISSLRSHHIRSIFQETLSKRYASLISKKRDDTVQRILAAKDALDLAIDWDPKKKMGHQFFCCIHRLIQSNPIDSKDNGRIRNRQNWIGPEGCKIEEAYFYPPAAAKIRPLLRNLEVYSAKQTFEPLMQLAIAFAQLLIIHPFMNGNGRVARIMVPVGAYRKKLLVQPALFMSFYFETHRNNYFQKLFNISEKNNWEDWIAFFLTGVISQANLTRNRFDRLAKLWHETADLSDETKANLLFRQSLIHSCLAGEYKKLIEQKFLIARGKGSFFFDPLIRTMRKEAIASLF
jgi:Fic family protein